MAELGQKLVADRVRRFRDLVDRHAGPEKLGPLALDDTRDAADIDCDQIHRPPPRDARRLTANGDCRAAPRRARPGEAVIAIGVARGENGDPRVLFKAFSRSVTDGLPGGYVAHLHDPRRRGDDGGEWWLVR